MKQLVAIHVIIRGDEDGKLERIEPGKSFSAENKEADDLLARGAARLAVKDSEAQDDAEEQGGEVNLEDMAKNELIAHAKEHGIEVDEAATKAVILAAIQAASGKDSELI